MTMTTVVVETGVVRELMMVIVRMTVVDVVANSSCSVQNADIGVDDDDGDNEN